MKHQQFASHPRLKALRDGPYITHAVLVLLYFGGYACAAVAGGVLAGSGFFSALPIFAAGLLLIICAWARGIQIEKLAEHVHSVEPTLVQHPPTWIQPRKSPPPTPYMAWLDEPITRTRLKRVQWPEERGSVPSVAPLNADTEVTKTEPVAS
jgi:hypothetical protein